MVEVPSKDCNCPLKMNIIERILWFAMVVTMLVVIAIGQLKDEEFSSQTQDSAEETSSQQSNQTQSTQTQPKPKKYAALVTLPINNGFQIYTNLEDEPLHISKITKNQVASAGIKVESLEMGYYEYRNSVEEIIYPGPDGWEYYKNPYWNPAVDAKVLGHVSKIYFKEKEDKIIQITLNDTSGGKYDKDIEALIKTLHLHGGVWGED